MNVALLRGLAVALSLMAGTEVHAAGRLTVEDAWIRAAPPGAMMLAGYMVLGNAGDAPVVLAAADSDAFGEVSMHRTVEEHGVARMRPLERVSVAPGQRVVFAPGGMHLMLMQPKRALHAGDRVTIRLMQTDGAATPVEFAVR
ncbi:copper metallochaperone, bacterial Cox17-like protein [Mizugakiibacter sediminis]|uniref:Copper metallochaperone, bacterial Cox17-like protein n=1 Tax=Mizugakiibacter sediminis TaxID=1475481 RepID=A0A0K8QRV6_9GAMM|nr:copper chaperone PCu(A)C [Mizugakiibacter sediminis]GAP67411.1 copper metallochaperone, bacterial Cox17-like protein [Mizugakiibacter sediminis]